MSSNDNIKFDDFATYLFVKSCLFVELCNLTITNNPLVVLNNNLNEDSFKIFDEILKKYRGYFIHSNKWAFNTKENISNEIRKLFDEIKTKYNRFFKIKTTSNNDSYFQQNTIIKILNFIQDRSTIKILIDKSNLTKQDKKYYSLLSKGEKLLTYLPYEYLRFLQHCYNLFFCLKQIKTIPDYKKSIHKTIGNFIKFVTDFISFVGKYLFNSKHKYDFSFGKFQKKLNKRIKYLYNIKLNEKDIYRWRDFKIFCNFNKKDKFHPKFQTFFISFETLCKVIDDTINNKCIDNTWIYSDICKKFSKALKRIDNDPSLFPSYKYNFSKTYKDYGPFNQINKKNITSLHTIYKYLRKILLDYYWRIYIFLLKQLIVIIVKQLDTKIKIDDSKINIIKSTTNKLYSCKISYDTKPEFDFSLKQFRSLQDYALNSLSIWLNNYFSSNINFNWNSSNTTITIKKEKIYIYNHCHIISMFKKIEDKIYTYLYKYNFPQPTKFEEINKCVKQTLLKIFVHDEKIKQNIKELYCLRGKITHLNVSNNKNLFSHIWDGANIKFLKAKTKLIIHLLNKIDIILMSRQ